ncbi:MAG: hypothetical protein U9N34_09990 [Candidatus Cloacimonadota bacterium]|nr:hypothetical protein [Candidatus Cloacimonadota bacterium]
MIKYKLIISPSINIDDRHSLQRKLEQMGYNIIGTGTDLVNDEMDISFEKKTITEESDV